MRLVMARIFGLAIGLVVFLAPASPVHADIDTGLVGYWPFSGNAQDASGNGNHGTPNAAAQLTADRHGVPASAYLFDGLSARIDIPSSPSLAAPTSEITLAAWIRRDGWGLVGTQYNPILTKSIGTANAFQYRWIITQSGMGTAFNSWAESGSTALSFDEGVWYHVASTWKDDTLRHYVNGSLVDTQPFAVTIVPDTRTLSIGSDVPGVLEIFLGAIDEVRIYSRALSDADIAELADVPTATPLAPSSWTLGAGRPNPSSGTVILPLFLEQDTPVGVDVFDLRGRRVRQYPERRVSGGDRALVWDGRDDAGDRLPAGSYFLRVKARGQVQTRKVALQR